MAQQCVRPTGKHGDHAPTVRGEIGVPDGEDAALEAMQPPTPDPLRDRPVAIAERVQLTDGHHSVLTRRQFSQHHTTWPRFRSHRN